MDAEKLKDEEWALLFAVRRSVRYHMRRMRFFDSFHSMVSAVGVLAGSGTAISFLSDPKHEYLGSWFGLTFAAFSAIDLVVGTGPKARLHNDLATQFIELEIRIVAKPSGTPEELSVYQAERLRIEEKEPPVLRILDVLCHNELVKASGLPDEEMYEVPALKRFFAHFISFDASRLAHVK